MAHVTDPTPDIGVDYTKTAFKLLMLIWTLWAAWVGTQFLQSSWTTIRVWAVLLGWGSVMLALVVLMPAVRWLAHQWADR